MKGAVSFVETVFGEGSCGSGIIAVGGNGIEASRLWPKECEMSEVNSEKAMAGDRGDAKAQPSGPKGDNPATAGRGTTDAKSNTPENAVGKLDPSAPGETGTTPGTNWKKD